MFSSLCKRLYHENAFGFAISNTLSKMGRPKHSMRISGMRFPILPQRCQWAMLPKDFPPFTTVQYYFYRLAIVDCLISSTKPWSVLADWCVTVMLSQRLQSLIANRQNHESGGISGFDRERRSRGVSVILRQIRKVTCFMAQFILPIFKTVAVRLRSSIPPVRRGQV